ncbi:hypothetical protein BB560_003516, partial [Smittium megazygosporum]
FEEGTNQYLYDISGLWKRALDLDIGGNNQSSEISIGLPNTHYFSEDLFSGDIVGSSQVIKMLENHLTIWDDQGFLPETPRLKIFTDASSTGWDEELLAIKIAFKNPEVQERPVLIHADNVTIPKVAYVPSVKNPADAPSRLFTQTEWSLKKETFKKVNNIYGPHDMDLFASKDNCKARDINFNSNNAIMDVGNMVSKYTEFTSQGTLKNFTTSHNSLLKKRISIYEEEQELAYMVIVYQRKSFINKRIDKTEIPFKTRGHTDSLLCPFTAYKYYRKKVEGRTWSQEHEYLEEGTINGLLRHIKDISKPLTTDSITRNTNSLNKLTKITGKGGNKKKLKLRDLGPSRAAEAGISGTDVVQMLFRRLLVKLLYVRHTLLCFEEGHLI